MTFNITQSKKRKLTRLNAFTLIELLIVTTILAILAGLAISYGSNTSQAAKRQFALETLIKTKEALLRFREDMGDFPGEGELVRGNIDVEASLILKGTNDHGFIGPISNPGGPSSGTAAGNHRIWSGYDLSTGGIPNINLWMLFSRPVSSITGEADKWIYNKDTRKGWNGPYIKDDRNATFYPQDDPSYDVYGNYYAISDVFSDTPDATLWYNPSHRNGDSNIQETLGSPIRFAKLSTGYFVISAGPNGIYEGGLDGTDDIKLLVSQL